MPNPNPEEAFAALRRGGLLINDPDLVKLFDTSKPDYVERARAAKPSLFAFDARRATPQEVEQRLSEIETSFKRRGFQRQCDALLDELREPPPTSAAASAARKPAPARVEVFDASTAMSEEVEARLHQLIGGL